MFKQLETNQAVEVMIEIRIVFQGGFGLAIDVWDDDSGKPIGSADDYVDRQRHNLYIDPGRSVNSQAQKSFQISGRRSVIAGTMQ